MAKRMFPILSPNAHNQELRAYVPWALVEPHEAQAQANHGQSLQHLAGRGGLAAQELAAVLEDRRYHHMSACDAWEVIFRHAAEDPSHD